MRPWVILLILAGLVVGIRSLARRQDVRAGVETMAGKTTVAVGQDMKRKTLQSNLRRAVRQYRSTVGSEPGSLEDLATEGMLPRLDQVDEWGRALIVERTSSGFSVRSAGADGRRGTQDDWVLVP